MLFLFYIQSFADVRGKGIICVGENKDKSLTNSIVIGWFVENDNMGIYCWLERGVASVLYAVSVMSTLLQLTDNTTLYYILN